MVSVTERSERDLTKRFPGINIDWTVIQTQLEAWSQYFQKGKELRVNLSFNYIQVGPGGQQWWKERRQKRADVNHSSDACRTKSSA